MQAAIPDLCPTAVILISSSQTPAASQNLRVSKAIAVIASKAQETNLKIGTM